MKESPSVTAVMVTGHDPRRRALAAHTACRFVLQTHPRAELLIVNQGDVPLLHVQVPRVREVLDGRGLVVGALRNLAWNHATGDLMTCWDDDDVHHPERIAFQVAKFRGRPAALKSELYFHLVTGEAFAFARNSGFENTLLWPRACASRYPAMPRSSDAHFHSALKREFGGIDTIANPPALYVRLYHGHNIWPEGHFFKLPRQQVASPKNNAVALRDPTQEEHELLETVRRECTEIAP